MATLYTEVGYASLYLVKGMDRYKRQAKKFLLDAKKFCQKSQKIFKREVENFYIRSLFYDLSSETMIVYTKYQGIDCRLECKKIGKQILVSPQWEIPISCVEFTQKCLNYWLPSGGEDCLDINVLPSWRPILHSLI